MPAFAVFYNGYFQERSKMNMQMMDLMLKQASPQYLTSMIEKTQSNIAELQKTRDKIISSDQKNKSQLALKQAEMEFAATKINAKVSQDDNEFTKKLIAGESKSGSKSNFYADKNKDTEQNQNDEIKSTKLAIDRNLIDTTRFADENTFMLDNNLDSKHLEDVALALEVIKEGKENYVKQRGENYIIRLKKELESLIPPGKTPDDILATTYRFARGTSQTTPTTKTTQAAPKDRADELGFNLTDTDKEFADVYITKKDGKLTIKQIPKKGMPVSYGALPKSQREVIQKRLKQRLLQEKKGYVSAPKIKGGDSDLQERLDAIDKQLTKESEKLQGYFTRYDVGQQDVLDKVFSPFDTNYRTQNLFVRKSPEVLKQEQEIRDMQYAERKDTPSAYANLQYNTEYQAPGGLNFGITKLGEEEIPYIFEKGTPYEISEGDPSYSFILELLAEQDKQLGGLK